MMDLLAQHGGTVVLLVFFVIFIGTVVWAFAPSNRNKLEGYARIPLKENDDGR